MKHLRHAMGVSDPALTAEIERLRRETGGLPTGISSAPEARRRTLTALGPVAAAIPRCGAGRATGPGRPGLEGP